MAAPAPLSHEASAATQALIEELEGMALDPTLDQCCRRDLHSQIERERVRAALQRADRIDARQRAAAEAPRRDAAALEALAAQQQQKQQQQQQGEGQAGGGGANAGDAELAALRAQRLQELQARSAAAAEQQRSGFGRLNDVPEGRLMALLSEPPGRGLLVVHLAVQGYEPSNELDEVLSTAASHYRGTYFARVAVARSSAVVARLALPMGAPALLVAKHGAVLGKAHLSQFGGADVREEEVMSYLHRFKVLTVGGPAARGPGGSSGRGAAAPDSSDGEDDDGSEGGGADGGGWAAPCEVCGRTYPHEHIRAVRASNQEAGSSEDNGD